LPTSWLPLCVHACRHQRKRRGRAEERTSAMMSNMGGMMWGMGLVWLLVVVVLVLAVAALVKYLFFKG